MKRLIPAWFAMIAMFAPVVYAQSDEIPFNDYENHKYEEAIVYLFEEDIISGYPDGTFKPDKTINRAELLKIIIESNFNETDYESFEDTSCFSDVTGNLWFSKYVCFAKNKEIIEGYPDGTFKPEREINLIESLKIMYEGIGMAVDNPNAIFKFKYYSPAMRAGYIPKELSGGYENIMTRGQVSEIIYRILMDEDKKMKSEINLNLTVYKQQYYASCGTAALAIALSQQTYVTENEILDEMIAMGLYPNNEIIEENGVYVWDDPQQVFVGDYNGLVSIYMSKLKGFGFLEGPLEELAQNWAPNSEKFSGKNFSFIARELEEGHPVIVFGNVNARSGSVILTEPGTATVTWQLRNSGETITIPMYKHNLVVEGYVGTPEAPESFYIVDPFYGQKIEMTKGELEGILAGYNYSGVVVKF